MSTSDIDPKVLGRLQKLLNLARDSGATEGEASTAMELAKSIMDRHNLTMAELDDAGPASAVKRLNAHLKGAAMYDYQRDLMSQVAASCYCVISVLHHARRSNVATGYRLIGREDNVASATVMFSYLNQTINRLAKERFGAKGILGNAAISWKHGMAWRLGERIKERHEAGLKAQEAEATARRAAQASSSGGGTSLVVVLREFSEDERHANRDHYYKWAPGTSQQREEDQTRRIAEADARERELWESLHPAEREAREAKAEADAARYAKRERARRDRYWDRRDGSQFNAGYKRGAEIGLDQQLDEAAPVKKLS